jgi:Flp pilus assembly protein TadG
LSLLLLVIVAALGFDTGMVMLERRDQQNAADAAALAGVRYLPATSTARSRALAMAAMNGYDPASDASVSIRGSVNATRIEVNITRQMPSLFAAAAGRTTWDVSALAVAVKMDDDQPFAALVALSPDDCPAVLISGTGVVASNGDVQVNSACPDQALKISGQGTLELAHDGLGCYVVGGSQVSGKANGTYCDPPQAGSPMTFPITGMPMNTSWPPPPLQVGGTTKSIPNGCPGSTTPATDAAPAVCQFQSNYAGTTWRLYPGYYPGGIKLQGGIFYLEPGIYHLAGGGLQAAGNGVDVISVDVGGTSLGGGVLLFNTTHPLAASGGIQLGGSSAKFNLHPLGGIHSCEPSEELEPWERYLIFQDPAVTNEIVINAGDSDVSARGLIFAPTANVKVNGGTGTLTIDAIIAYTFQINGNEGNINVLYDSCALPTFTGYGLII